MGLSAFQFDKEAKADPGRRSQLILAQALGKPNLTDDGTNLFDSHAVMFPIGNISVPFSGKSGSFPDREISDKPAAKWRSFPDREIAPRDALQRRL